MNPKKGSSRLEVKQYEKLRYCRLESHSSINIENAYALPLRCHFRMQYKPSTGMVSSLPDTLKQTYQRVKPWVCPLVESRVEALLGSLETSSMTEHHVILVLIELLLGQYYQVASMLPPSPMPPSRSTVGKMRQDESETQRRLMSLSHSKAAA